MSDLRATCGAYNMRSETELRAGLKLSGILRRTARSCLGADCFTTLGRALENLGFMDVGEALIISPARARTETRRYAHSGRRHLYQSALRRQVLQCLANKDGRRLQTEETLAGSRHASGKGVGLSRWPGMYSRTRLICDSKPFFLVSENFYEQRYSDLLRRRHILRIFSGPLSLARVLRFLSGGIDPRGVKCVAAAIWILSCGGWDIRLSICLTSLFGYCSMHDGVLPLVTDHLFSIFKHILLAPKQA